MAFTVPDSAASYPADWGMPIIFTLSSMPAFLRSFRYAVRSKSCTENRGLSANLQMSSGP